MANDDQSSTNSNAANIRQPQPEAAAVDPRNAALQDQVRQDAEASRDQADRVQASAPSGVNGRTVQQIADDAERRARR